MSDFKAGDRVYVTDPGLAQLRAVMKKFGQEVRPNHHGTIERVEDGYAVIVFDDTESSAPYSFDEVRHLSGVANKGDK